VSALTPERWQEISPYLDQVLSLPEEERAAWLRTVREEKPELAELLEKLLEEHRAAAQEQFLELRPSQPSNEAWSGQTIGSYTLISPISQGGMGSVWLAERSDGRFQRRVAIKFLRFTLAGWGAAERFKREGKILGQLEHPHIAELLDAGLTPKGEPYLVLEHVDGEPIDQYCDLHGLSVEARISLFLDVISAVAQAHANLVVHRDIKPSNVLVRKDGQAKLLDFGIAKLLANDSDPGMATQLTLQGGGALTPQFAAPEQISGGTITTATDVYALGALLYILLTGRHPAGSDAHSPAELVKAIVETEPPRASDAIGDSKAVAEKRGTTTNKLRLQLRGDVDTIVGKALKKNARERYASVTTFAEDLGRYLRHEPISARPDTLRYRTAKFVSRNRTVVALATCAFVATIGGVTGTLMQARAARRQRDFAFGQVLHAEAVNDLENFVLNDAAPSGKPFTVDQLLDRAEQIVERQHGTEGNRVELLVSIGRHYSGRDEDAKARRVLENAYRLSRSLTDHAIRADASCALASALADAGEPQRAEALFQEGIHELPQEVQYIPNRFGCLLRGREVADARGDADTAIARVQQARDLLQHSPFESDILQYHASIDLAESYRQAGRYAEAMNAFQQASVQLLALGRDNTETADSLYNNWAMALFQIGRPLEAERLFRQAMDISRTGSSDAALSPMLLLNYGKTLRELARLDQAAGFAERAYDKARQAGDEAVTDQSLLERARIYREQGNFSGATEMLAEVEPRLRRNLPPGHYAFAGLACERSLILLANGDTRKALQLANEAIAIDEAAVGSGRQGAGLLPILLFRRSAIELELRDSDSARTDAERALSMLLASVQAGSYSANVGRAYLALGRALQEQAKPGDARVAFQSAAEHLERTLGPDHPESRTARQLAARVVR